MEAYALIKATIRLLQDIHDAPKDFADLKRTLERVACFQASLIDQDLTQDQEQMLGESWKDCRESLKDVHEVFASYAEISSHGVMALYYKSKWTVTRKSIRLTKDLNKRLNHFAGCADIISQERSNKSRRRPAKLELPLGYAEFDRLEAIDMQNRDT
ncbi:hypothetical protein MMC18_002627 [Xylographa bjoerkii]|nr:hypothetical protein [Xylographa bjoerkii]